jgi:hypothetical protein
MYGDKTSTIPILGHIRRRSQVADGGNPVMSIAQVSEGRLSDGERLALRQGLAASSRFRAALQLVQRQTPAAAYCATCAAPIDFGAVWRGEEEFCSVECSLGTDQPA